MAPTSLKLLKAVVEIWLNIILSGFHKFLVNRNQEACNDMLVYFRYKQHCMSYIFHLYNCNCQHEQA